MPKKDSSGIKIVTELIWTATSGGKNYTKPIDAGSGTTTHSYDQTGQARTAPELTTPTDYSTPSHNIYRISDRR